MNHTICATCDYLDREFAKDANPKVWQCDAPRTRVVDYVTGKDRVPWVLCKKKNTGGCKHWCPYDATDLMEVLGIKKRFPSRKLLWHLFTGAGYGIIGALAFIKFVEIIWRP